MSETDLNIIPARLLHSRREAARLLAISQRTLDSLIRSGELRCKRVGRRVLVEAQALHQFATSGCPQLVVG